MSFRKRHSKAFVLLVALIFSSFAYSASFDCAKAGNEIEKRICANEQISALDSELGAAYKKAFSIDSTLKESQIAWIKERNKCIDDECIAKSYKERIAFLNSLDNLKRENNDIKSAGDQTSSNSESVAKVDNPNVDKQQEKIDQQALAAMADAKALRGELKQATEQDERDKDALIAFAIASCVLILIIYGIYKLLVYLKNKGKLALAKSAIKKKYKGLSIINGAEIDESKFSNSHIKEIKIKSANVLHTEVFFLSIPYADVNSSHACNWTGEKGEVNEGLYNNAMQTYRLARQQYELARDAAQRAQRAFFQSSPTEPYRWDFVSYYSVNGSSSISLSHGVIRLLSEITFSGRKNKEYLINLNEFSSTLDEIYEEVIINTLNEKLKKSPDDRLLNFDTPTNSKVYDIIREDYISALSDDANLSLGLYSRNVSLGSINNNLNRSDTTLTIVLTISSLKSGKSIVTLHDYLTPDIILDTLKI
jgi:uncharacterized protein